jgi:putative FmdB family regulatory protein
MPTYDYKCLTCQKEFEHFQSMKEDALTECLCDKKGKVTRLISNGGGIIFKGSGFYVTDYKKSTPSDTSSKNTTTPSKTDG